MFGFSMTGGAVAPPPSRAASEVTPPIATNSSAAAPSMLPARGRLWRMCMGTPFPVER